MKDVVNNMFGHGSNSNLSDHANVRYTHLCAHQSHRLSGYALHMPCTCVYPGTVSLKKKWHMQVVLKRMGTESTTGTVGRCPLPRTGRPDD